MEGVVDELVVLRGRRVRQVADEVILAIVVHQGCLRGGRLRGELGHRLMLLLLIGVRELLVIGANCGRRCGFGSGEVIERRQRSESVLKRTTPMNESTHRSNDGRIL